MKEKLMSKIKKIGDYWEWQGCLNNKDVNKGYGITYYKENGKRVLAHRASYEVFKGKIPKGLFICHTCDNRRCINPDHLWLGTRSENAKDAVRKGRMTPIWGRKKTQEEIDKIQKNRKIPDQKGVKHYRAILNNEKVLKIREMLENGFKYREISEMFGIKTTSVADIKFRRTWTHI